MFSIQADGAEVKLEEKIVSNGKEELATDNATGNRRELRDTNNQTAGGLRRDIDSRTRKPVSNVIDCWFVIFVFLLLNSKNTR